MADAAQKSAEAVAQQTNSQAAGNQVLAQNVAALKKQMLQRPSQLTVDKLLASYAQLPGSFTTKVSAPGADTTAAELDKIRQKIAAVPAGKNIVMVKAPFGPSSHRGPEGHRVQGHQPAQPPDQDHRADGIAGRGRRPAAGEDRRADQQDRDAHDPAERAGREDVVAGCEERHRHQRERQRVPSVRQWRHGAARRADRPGRGVAAVGRAGDRRRGVHPARARQAGPAVPSHRRPDRADAREGVAWANGGVRRFAGGGFTYTPADPTSTLGRTPARTATTPL